MCFLFRMLFYNLFNLWHFKWSHKLIEQFTLSSSVYSLIWLFKLCDNFQVFFNLFLIHLLPSLLVFSTAKLFIWRLITQNYYNYSRKWFFFLIVYLYLLTVPEKCSDGGIQKINQIWKIRSKERRERMDVTMIQALRSGHLRCSSIRI